MSKTWTAVQSRSLPNLQVLSLNGREVGFIYKPKDSSTDKNAWRCHSGIGDANQFLGHNYDARDARKMVERSVS